LPTDTHKVEINDMNDTLYYRPAQQQDMKLLFHWVNEPAVRAMSFHSDPITWECHVSWFQHVMESPMSSLFVAMDTSGTAVGQIRLDAVEDHVEVSYSVDVGHRGKGYGTLLLRQAAWLSEGLYPHMNQLVARVKPENKASIQAMLKSGYTLLSSGQCLTYAKALGDDSPGTVQIDARRIGRGEPCYVIAEMSANHAGSLERALRIVHAAADAGADCVKIQTYTADTMTLDSDKEWFRIQSGTWAGWRMHQLYRQAHTPWEWHEDIMREAQRCGLDFLSTPFDRTSVDFLEDLGVAFYKIASFELTDIPLITYVASKNKPIILSTGMGSVKEIAQAVAAIRSQGNHKICLLKCSSAYPARPDDMNLLTIPHLQRTFNVPVGLSDHSMGSMSATVGVSLGACILEKHLCVSRQVENPDASFSMEPDEFADMVRAVRTVEKALGHVSYEPSGQEKANRIFRRSIFVAQPIRKGEQFTEINTRVVRPAYGLEPTHYPEILGRQAACDLETGTPLSWDMVD